METKGVTCRFGLTDAGTAVLRGAGFVTLAALIIPAFGVLSALISVLGIAFVVGYLLRPKIEVQGTLPHHVIAGQTAQLTYRLRNVARCSAYDLRVCFRALPSSIEQVGDGRVLARLAPGETAEVTVTIRPARRGYYRIKPPLCESGFPFNLFRFGSAQGKEETLVVLPAFSRLHIPARSQSRHVHAGGARLAGRMGIAPEYMGNRPFLPGDSPRRIDARAWARLSVPATKEYDDDIDNYGALILDTRVPAARLSLGPCEVEELEAAVSLCASVAFTIGNDCLIDFLLAGPDLHDLAGRPRAARLDTVHELLAGVEPARQYRLDPVGPQVTDRFYATSRAIFILLRWDQTYRPLLEAADRAGCRTTVVVVNGSKPSPVDEEALNWAEHVGFVDAADVLGQRLEHL
jgi:uncharacterized protein (DUF58 family)